MTCPDWRHITNGRPIPSLGYCDQPYVVVTDDGAWLCVVTSGPGREGEPGQTVITMRSRDRGRTWSEPVYLEPIDGPEASYAVLLGAPGGRVYCVYNYNAGNVREVLADRCDSFPDGVCRRVDSLGEFVFRYSDDGGRTWSPRRYTTPVREMAIDRTNPYGGAIRFFWNVGRPFIHGDAAYVPLHKVGGFGEGFFTSSEGVLLRSDDLLRQSDPAAAHWQTLPDGDRGLRTPPGGGPIAEEHSHVVLSDGSLYAVYRSIDGHPVETYSRDGGHRWEAPRYKRYADGRLMKHPRAANFVWACGGGRYLYWFHNHGGRFIAEHPRRRTAAYEDRNPAWLSAGTEVDGPNGREIAWSQPEIALYDDDPAVRMSYPDLIQDGGRYYLTETQKTVARVHELDSRLLEMLWGQPARREVAAEGLLLSLPLPGQQVPASAPLPPLPAFREREPHGVMTDRRAGISLDIWLRLDSLRPGQVLLDSRTPDGRGFSLCTAAGGAVAISLADGRCESVWGCDPGLLRAGSRHHLAVIVDGGPKLLLFVVDGRLCDGGEQRQFGWGRFHPHLRGVGGGDLRIAPGVDGALEAVRLYGRALTVTEAVGNWRAGLEAR